MQSSLGSSKMNEMQAGRKEVRCPAGTSKVVKETPLTNGHTHVVNGALKPEDLTPCNDYSSSDRDMPKYGVTSSPDKPQNPTVHPCTKHDPYEFPPSPPKQSDLSSGFLEQSSTQGAKVQRTKSSPSSCPEAVNSNENQLLPKSHVISEQTPPSRASCSPSHSSVRLNGSHHNVFPSNLDSPSTTTITDKHDRPVNQAPSRAAAKLLEQTGGLLSEFYSHSRLHQISTWRINFSEYINELHSKQKATGIPSFSGKDRLKKSGAQRSSDSQGRKGWTFLFHSVDFCCSFL